MSVDAWCAVGTVKLIWSSGALRLRRWPVVVSVGTGLLGARDIPGQWRR